MYGGMFKGKGKGDGGKGTFGKGEMGKGGMEGSGKGFGFKGAVNPNKSGWGYQGVCWRCGKVGHNTAECTVNLQEVEGEVK